MLLPTVYLVSNCGISPFDAAHDLAFDIDTYWPHAHPPIISSHAHEHDKDIDGFEGLYLTTTAG
jgi:glyoxylate utilization-related uncharacterized protein